MADLIAILALSGVCALWVLLQRAAKRLDPHDPGVARDCGGCRQATSASGAACQDRCRVRA